MKPVDQVQEFCLAALAVDQGQIWPKIQNFSRSFYFSAFYDQNNVNSIFSKKRKIFSKAKNCIKDIPKKP